MRIDVSYNDVNLELFVSNRKLDQDKMNLIRDKAFKFFDSLLEICINDEVSSSEEDTAESFKILGFTSGQEVTPEIMNEKGTSEITVNSVDTVNQVTGDKRVEKRRYEDMSIEALGVDIRGIPWDPQIHANTKTKRKDGTWKLKKGSNLLQAAEKEKQILQDLPPPPPPSEETVEIKNREIPKTFNEMMNFIDEIIDTGRIDTSGVMKILADLGFNSILHLRDNGAVYDKVYAQFHSVLGGVL